MRSPFLGVIALRSRELERPRKRAGENGALDPGALGWPPYPTATLENYRNFPATFSLTSVIPGASHA
jgi:hypothetical protein